LGAGRNNKTLEKKFLSF